MDIKIKLKDDKDFMTFLQASQSMERIPTTNIINLAKKNIITVEDFINTDVTKMSVSRPQRERYRIIQEILNYKYLGKKLIRDVILDESVFCYNETNIYNTLLGLGIRMRHNYVVTCIMAKINENTKVVDILKYFRNFAIISQENSGAKLAEFYIEYYEKEIANKNEESLESLKHQLEELINKKNEIDESIVKLNEIINSKEKGENNGKKHYR